MAALMSSRCVFAVGEFEIIDPDPSASLGSVEKQGLSLPHACIAALPVITVTRLE